MRAAAPERRRRHPVSQRRHSFCSTSYVVRPASLSSTPFENPGVYATGATTGLFRRHVSHSPPGSRLIFRRTALQPEVQRRDADCTARVGIWLHKMSVGLPDCQSIVVRRFPRPTWPRRLAFKWRESNDSVKRRSTGGGFTRGRSARPSDNVPKRQCR